MCTDLYLGVYVIYAYMWQFCNKIFTPKYKILSIFFIITVLCNYHCGSEGGSDENFESY